LGVQFLVDTAKRFIVDESEQQLVMTGAAGVGSGENCIDDPQPARSAWSLRRQSLARWHCAFKH
jgi:hypothetical protein